LPAQPGARPPAKTLATRRSPPGLWAGTPSRGGPRLAAVRIAASSLMALRFGLDFVTSNTSLAVNDGSSTRVMPIDRLVGETMPTVLYIRRDGSALVGREAIDAYLEDNRTRGPLKREIKMLGIRLPSTDWTHKSLEAYILTDTSAPGRFFQALKTFLSDPLDTRTNVFGDAKGLEDLIALVLAHVRARAGEHVGEAPEAVTIGRPVRVIGTAGTQESATTRIHAAPELAGFREVP